MTALSGVIRFIILLLLGFIGLMKKKKHRIWLLEDLMFELVSKLCSNPLIGFYFENRSRSYFRIGFETNKKKKNFGDFKLKLVFRNESKSRSEFKSRSTVIPTLKIPICRPKNKVWGRVFGLGPFTEPVKKRQMSYHGTQGRSDQDPNTSAQCGCDHHHHPS